MRKIISKSREVAYLVQDLITFCRNAFWFKNQWNFNLFVLIRLGLTLFCKYFEIVMYKLLFSIF